MIRRTSAIHIALCLLLSLVTALAAETQTFSFAGSGSGPVLTTFQLMNMTKRIQALETDKKHAVTPAQASKALSLLKPLRSKPKLTMSQANTALAGMSKILTPAQNKAADALMAKQTKGMKMPGGVQMSGTGTSFVQRTGPDGKVTTITTKGKGTPGGGTLQFRSNSGAPIIVTSSGGTAAPDFNPFYTKPSPTGLPSKITIKNMNAFFSLMERRAKSK